MIEIIQQTEKTEDKLESKLPKNIRQIGNPEKDFRIYMEDYVYTYLHPAQIHGMEMGILPRLLILVGEINHFSNRSCAFISGAIQVESGGLSEELPELNDRTWRRIHKEMQQYFDKCEIVGWVLDVPGNTLEVTREMEEIHRKNFVSPYQFFFLMDSKEREEAFYTWKAGRLVRKEGYFIYYEKNPQMQEYMISRREATYGEKPPIEEVEDEAAKHYRAMMLEKKEHTYKRRAGFLSYLTSILMVIVLCSVSLILLASIRRMDSMEESISVMSVAMDATEKEAENAYHQVTVETIGGNVLPTGEGQAKENDTARENISQGVENASQGAETTVQESENASQGAETTVQGAASPQQEVATAQEVAPQAEATDQEIYRTQGYYVVEEGDSLQQICYDIYQTYAMLDTLCEANAIDDENTIYVGQKIILP